MNLKSILTLSAFAVVGAANANLLSYYSFNVSTAGTGGNLGTIDSTAPDIKDASVTSAGFTNNFVASNIGTFGGTTVNAQSGYVSGGALAVQNGTSGANNGNYVQFGLSSTTNAFSAITLSFASQRTATGFNSNQLSYSTNGTTFTNFGSAYTAASSFASAGTGVVQNFDLSSVAALTGTSTVYLRITFTGGSTTSSAGNNRIDNLTINGNVQAVPEPTTMAVLGLGAFGVLRRRRSAK